VVEEWTAIEDRFDTPADKEWVGTPIPLEQVTTAVQLDKHLEEDCVISFDPVTPPGVRTVPCNHTYCASCLQRWIHACESASHKCPHCRATLFPEPQYKYKQPEVVENYQAQQDALEVEHKRLEVLNNSLNWFSGEIALQERLERRKGEAAS
jgi:hypothetical protein